MKEFKNEWIVLCPWNIDSTCLKICKCSSAFAKDYFYHKTRGYYVVLQAIVYIYIFVGLPSSINNSCALRELAFYNKAQCHNLFSPNEGVEGIPPYVIIVALTKMCLWT